MPQRDPFLLGARSNQAFEHDATGQPELTCHQRQQLPGLRRMLAVIIRDRAKAEGLWPPPPPQA